MVDIMAAIECALKDHGIDWILEERGSIFQELLDEIELAISKGDNPCKDCRGYKFKNLKERWQVG